MKKIAFIMPNLLPMPAVKGGATETLVQRLIDDNEIFHKYLFYVFSRYNAEAEALSSKYHHTRFIYISEQGDLLSDFQYLCFRLRRKISKKYIPEPYICKIVKKINMEKLDTIIVESSFRFIPYIKNQTGCRVYLHLHFDAVNSNGMNLEEAIKACDGIISVSKYIADRINSRFPDVPTTILPNVTDPDCFRKLSDKEENALRIKYRLQADDTILLFSGRLCELKGVLELLKAFKIAYQQNNTLKLLVVGSAEYGETVSDSYYQSLVSEAGDLLNHVIFFTGYIPYSEMPIYYSLADISLLTTTSVEEAAPLSVLEALSSECFFIGSDSGAIPEMADCEYKIIVQRNQDYVNYLADAIINATDILKHTNTTSKSGRQYILDKRDAKNYYMNFCELPMFNGDTL